MDAASDCGKYCAFLRVLGVDLLFFATHFNPKKNFRQACSASQSHTGSSGHRWNTTLLRGHEATCLWHLLTIPFQSKTHGTLQTHWSTVLLPGRAPKESTGSECRCTFRTCQRPRKWRDRGLVDWTLHICASPAPVAKQLDRFWKTPCHCQC